MCEYVRSTRLKFVLLDLLIQTSSLLEVLTALQMFDNFENSERADQHLNFRKAHKITYFTYVGELLEYFAL